jgi:hypothetical protein
MIPIKTFARRERARQNPMLPITRSERLACDLGRTIPPELKVEISDALQAIYIAEGWFVRFEQKILSDADISNEAGSFRFSFYLPKSSQEEKKIKDAIADCAKKGGGKVDVLGSSYVDGRYRIEVSGDDLLQVASALCDGYLNPRLSAIGIRSVDYEALIKVGTANMERRMHLGRLREMQSPSQSQAQQR